MDPPGIAELAPDLSGLDVTQRLESRALVHAGDAVRQATIVFATGADATQAFDRARADSYSAFLFHELHGRMRRLATKSGAGYRLTVGRPAEPGRDTVEIYVLRNGRRLVLVELLSAGGFEPKLRDEVLAAVSR